MGAFEYQHILIDAASSSESYPSGLVEEQLNKLGQEGWELVNMTPDWEWAGEAIAVSDEYEAVSKIPPYGVDAPYAVLDYVRGWYCTFKRCLS
jgi:hypothetical protein